MITIAIIGTAGSRDNMINFNREKFIKMIQATENVISKLGILWSEIELWSGGSSGADHIAVILSIKHNCGLRLFLPCDFINDKFYDNGNYQYSSNPGKQLNNLHNKFSNCISNDTLKDIKYCIGAKNYHVFNGFHARNIEVGKATYMISLTASDFPTEGGTKYTFNNATSIQSNRVHINILKLN